jgi:hypothetical protein
MAVDHMTINRRALKHSPHPEQAFHRRKCPVWLRWPMDETYIKKVNLDLWYPRPPTKGGYYHGNITVRRSPEPPH